MGKELFDASYSFHDHPRPDTNLAVWLLNTSNFLRFGAVIDTNSQSLQRLTLIVPLLLSHNVQAYRVVFSEENNDFLFIAHCICLNLARTWITGNDKNILNYLDKLRTLPSDSSLKQSRQLLSVPHTPIAVYKKTYTPRLVTSSGKKKGEIKSERPVTVIEITSETSLSAANFQWLQAEQKKEKNKGILFGIQQILKAKS